MKKLKLIESEIESIEEIITRAMRRNISPKNNSGNYHWVLTISKICAGDGK